jgi:arylsulfatase A-like enzyme
MNLKLILTLALATSVFAVTTLQAEAKKPNVLFIAVDDMRPELGCYGNKIVKTPNIDRIAARGMVFNHAYCQQAVCSPSRSSFLTGRRPDATRVWDLETHFRVALPDAITLPQHFKANGYYCAALSKIYHAGFEDGRSWNEPHWYPRGRSVDTDPVDWTKQIVTRHAVSVQEYSTAATPDPNDNDKPAANKKSKAGPAFEISPKADDELPDGATAAEAVKRLHEVKAKQQPFFLAVGFLKPHLPFVAPQKYWALYDPEKIPLPAIDHLPEGAPEFAGHNNSELHNYPGVPKENPIPADFAKKLRHGYYACISYTDAQIGRVLDALEKEGLADNTIIVLWGDHGWQLGDHGLWHKHTNFELATRAPLLLSVPHQKTVGQKCDAPVEFIDVYPTLADVCGLSIPVGLDGVSLKRFLENPAAPVNKVAISQYPRGASQASGTAVMGYSIRDERWRLTLWRERAGTKIIATELYDEQNDPAESINLASKPGHDSIIASLSKHIPPAVLDAPTTKTKSKKKGQAAAAKPATSASSVTSDPDGRGAKFDQLDKDKVGKISREYYLTHQSDAKAAAERFTKWDTNLDGFLSRAEYIAQGRKQPNAK